jgi:GDA1/CD39 (nucleoside phosphatase) family
MTQGSFNQKHRIESNQSWNRFRSISATAQQQPEELDGTIVQDEAFFLENYNGRRLHQKKKKHDDDEKKKSPSTPSKSANEADTVEQQKEDEYWTEYKMQIEDDEKHYRKKLRKQQKRIDEMYSNPNEYMPINMRTVHGLMIDAGSTGSRMHIYEWEPRILYSTKDIQQAVSGDKLSYPGTESRWTDRLRPGIGSFAFSIPDDDDEQLYVAISEYLQPLLDFGKAVLHSKRNDFGQFPIFLRATAGMRTLSDNNRSRIMNVVRSLLSNTTFNPFYFVNEQARVISGEEEAIYDWTGVNFLLGDLLQDSLGSGTVVNPVQTHGALDLGGSSTQISFYEPNEDIMANLFKLQIGQAKHWNVYGHSFLYYGMNDAMTRFQSRLAAEKTAEQRLITGVYNPCLPGGASVDIRTNIHLNSKGVETLNYYEQDYPSGNGYYQATLVNRNERGNFDHCMNVTQ